jgi:hypothetical protein
LKKVSSGAASTTYLYDQLGKVSASTNEISEFAAVPVFGYDYYLNGALKSELYPSGRAVNYEVDDAGRTNKVSGAAATPYVNATGAPADMFTADGRLKQMH